MSHELHEKFLEFVNTEWDENLAYTLMDFRELYNIDIRLARYHLMRLVDMGYIARLRIKIYKYETYYVRWDKAELFLALSNTTICSRRKVK